MPPDNNNSLKDESLKWPERRWFAYLLLCLYVLLAALPLVLPHLTRPGGISDLHGLARVLGFTGFTILALQVALGSRLRLIDGPFGRFSYQLDSPESFIFIAGGVGITPLLSMLRYLRDTNDRRPSVLICGNRTEKDIIGRGELKDMPENAIVAHVLNSPPRRSGMVTPALLTGK